MEEERATIQDAVMDDKFFILYTFTSCPLFNQSQSIKLSPNLSLRKSASLISFSISLPVETFVCMDFVQESNLSLHHRRNKPWVPEMFPFYGREGGPEGVGLGCEEETGMDE